MQKTTQPNITKKEMKIAKRIKRDSDLSELKSYYGKKKTVSKCDKEYINLVKRNKRTWTDNSIISFAQDGDKVILWPIGVK